MQKNKPWRLLYLYVPAAKLSLQCCVIAAKCISSQRLHTVGINCKICQCSGAATHLLQTCPSKWQYILQNLPWHLLHTCCKNLLLQRLQICCKSCPDSSWLHLYVLGRKIYGGICYLPALVIAIYLLQKLPWQLLCTDLP